MSDTAVIEREESTQPSTELEIEVPDHVISAIESDAEGTSYTESEVVDNVVANYLATGIAEDIEDTFDENTVFGDELLAGLENKYERLVVHLERLQLIKPETKERLRKEAEDVADQFEYIRIVENAEGDIGEVPEYVANEARRDARRLRRSLEEVDSTQTL